MGSSPGHVKLWFVNSSILVPAVAQRRQCVRGLPGLRDEEAGVVPEDDELKMVKTQAADLKMGVWRSRKSEARSTITGIWVSSSSSCRVAMAEW